MTAPGISSEYAVKREIMGDFVTMFEHIIPEMIPARWGPKIMLHEPPEAPGLGITVTFAAFTGGKLNPSVRETIQNLMEAVNMATDLVPSIPMEVKWIGPPLEQWGFLLRVVDSEGMPHYPRIITVPHIDLRATNLLRRKLGLPERDDVL